MIVQQNGNGTGGDGPAGADDPPMDELLTTLSDPRARYALCVLERRSDVGLEELTEAVTGMEAAAEDSVASRTDRERNRVRLYHAVLPKLDALGCVEFDSAEKRVARANVPTEISALLDEPG